MSPNRGPKEHPSISTHSLIFPIFSLCEAKIDGTFAPERMMAPRIGLIILQLPGALSLLPYPAILVANIMQIAAHGQTLLGALPFVLLSLYPLLWALLYVVAWTAFQRGGVNVAYALSAVPAVVSAIGVGAFSFMLFGSRNLELQKQAQAEAHVYKANPLAFSLLGYFGSNGFPPIPFDSALARVGDAKDVNAPAPEHGSPLGIALWHFRTDWAWDGQPDAKQSECLKLIGALLKRQARLTQEEQASIVTTMRLRLATMEGPNPTLAEHPLVWSIVTGELSRREPLVLNSREVADLNRPSKVYGTPLHAALVLPNAGFLAKGLIEKGARLSDEESKNPAAIAALESFVFRQYPAVRAAY